MPKSSCAIMFADISGSTRLYDRLGDDIAKQCIGQCLEQLTLVTAAHGGRVVKTIGDELMCRFEEVDSAIAAAQVSQQEVQSLRPHKDTRMSIRTGIHFGDVIEDNTDIFGDAVNLAARMAGIAKGGQIMTTQNTVDKMSPLLISNTRKVDVTRVKGKQNMIAVYEVLWEHDDEVTRMATQIFDREPPSAAQNLVLQFASSQCELGEEGESVSIGRGRDCDLQVETTLVSRTHARCELRRGKFVIIDQSTNGTYVTPEGGDEIYLRREELVLQGDGSISLGKPSAESTKAGLIRYSC